MTVLAILGAVLGCAGVAWWVWNTPGRPGADKPVAVSKWAAAASARAFAGMGVSIVFAPLLALLAGADSGAWPWVPAVFAAACALALTVTRVVTDPQGRVPLFVYPLGWIVLAIFVGVRMASSSTPTVGPGGVIDASTSIATGQRAFVALLLVGAVHTWWVRRSRNNQRDRADKKRTAQINAMRRRIDAENQSSPPMRGRRTR